MLLVDKPAGLTSHDVVARARRALGTRKVGHAGTLDPLATGLLTLGVGPATRLLTFLVGLDKTYETTIVLGWGTTTDDAEGEPLGPPARLDVLDAVGDERVVAVRDVRERATVDEGGLTLERLHQVRRQRILEENRHRPFGREVLRRHRLPLAGLGDDDPPEPVDEVVEAPRQAEDRHHLGSDDDVEAVLARPFQLIKGLDLCAARLHDWKYPEVLVCGILQLVKLFWFAPALRVLTQYDVVC